MDLTADQFALLEKLLAGSGAPSGVRRRVGNAPAPLSYAQEVLWLIDQNVPGLTAYNIHAAGSLSGPLDIGMLDASVSRIASRHEALRTTVATTPAGPVQQIHPPPQITTRRMSAPNSIGQTLADVINEPFDLQSDALLRSTLVEDSGGAQALALTSHHIAIDGWSRAILTRELGLIYSALARGEEPELPELPVQFADYAVWQREKMSTALNGLLEYWMGVLREPAPELDLRRTGRFASALDFAGAVSERAVDRSAHDALVSKFNTTSFTVVLAAYHAVIAHWSGARVITTGSPIAARQPGTENLIGYFANMLPLRSDLRDDPSFETLLARLRDCVTGAFDHQDVPLELLMTKMGTRTPLFRIALAMDAARATPVALGDVIYQPIVLPRAAAKFDLILRVIEREGALVFETEYRTSVMDEGAVTRFVSDVERVLSAARRNPATRVSEFPLSSR
jgi:hypothetical protein